MAGHASLRAAAAGYWTRRTLPTTPDAVVCGPGSKPLLFGLLLAIGADVAVPQPSWVSYAAQAGLIGAVPYLVPTPAGEGGVCDPASLVRAIEAGKTYVNIHSTTWPGGEIRAKLNDNGNPHD